MAKAKLQEIRDEALRRFGVLDISIVHRVGWMKPGDNIVVIGVSSVGRREGFEACSWTLERLKREVPLWKKEVTEGGERWVKDV
jgi:molybdopterin synthase catalytic subunit